MLNIVFEEPGPRFTPFHGGFGLLNTQGIKKPAYYSYVFLNKLGETELTNTDSLSYVCKNQNGDVQALCWDYTYTLPDSINNQQYYVRDLPAKEKGVLQLTFNNLFEGSYLLKVTRIGYQSNDAYTTYLKMGLPRQLTINQVQTIMEANPGIPYLIEVIEIKSDKLFTYQLPLHENDVYLVELVKN